MTTVVAIFVGIIGALVAVLITEILNKYWKNFEKTCLDRNDPFEKYINEIYEKEICISPIKSLSLHLTNVNSSYGLSPFIDFKKLWDQNI